MLRLIQLAKRHRRILWVVVVTVAAGYTYWQLRRIEQGHLFALALPWDRQPTRFEFADAKLSAESYLLPAIIVVVVLGGVTSAILSRLRFPLPPRTRSWRVAAVLCLIAALADLLTTLQFFHESGVDYELHPGIRLFGYAYGLTIGPIVGKLVQVWGVLLLSVVFGRMGTILLVAVALFYGIAAVVNFCYV